MGASYQGLFGTDGVRGKAGRFPMTTRVALLVGRAMAETLGLERPTVVVGQDPRRSSPVLQSALVAGLTSAGARVLDAGVFPTGGVSLLCNELGAAGGVVVSASHNPAEDNGIKLFGPGGSKLPEETERRIEARLEELASDPAAPEDGTGTAEPLVEAAEIYERRLLAASGLQPGELRGLRLAVDCAHGAAYRLTPAILRRLGATLRTLGVEPDGTNINANCGSQHPEALAEAVRHFGCHAGIALDGDADRVIFVDERSVRCDGDQLMALLAAEWQRRGTLRGGVVVATVMSNFSLERFLKGLGLELVRTPVGDKFVYGELLARGANLGGEQSGHLLFPDHSPSGDGLLTALMVLNTLRLSGRPLSELAGVLTPAPQILVNVPVPRKIPLEQLPGFSQQVQQVEAQLHGQGRVLIRYSGTENLLRIMVEGADRPAVEQHARNLVSFARRQFGIAE
jgi:phosphoglucosamine mutase